MGEKGEAHPLNVNICASCFSLPEGVPESSMSSFPDLDAKTLVEVDFHPVTAEPVKASAHGRYNGSTRCIAAFSTGGHIEG
jgi:hypothetical protein